MAEKKTTEKKEVQAPQPRNFGCFIGLHNWNGGNTCVNCGKKR